MVNVDWCYAGAEYGKLQGDHQKNNKTVSCLSHEDYGYYANNHVRMDRKLKTSFSDFWQEAGGWTTADKRFDELPLMEHRKTMEEVPTRKRAVYRKRFALLDEIDAAIVASMDGFLKR